MSADIPVVDCAALVAHLRTVPLGEVITLRGLPDDARDVCAALGTALETRGFVQATGHGVPPCALAALAAESRAFLGDPHRFALAQKLSRCYRGHSELAAEVTGGARDVKEGIDFGSDHCNINDIINNNNNGDDAATATATATATASDDDDDRLAAAMRDAIIGPNAWPDPNSYQRAGSFKSAVLEYMDRMSEFGRAVMCGIAVHLALPPDFFLKWFRAPCDGGDPPCHLMRILRYPPVEEGDAQVQGIGAHTDFGALAMLFQTAPGLQVLDRAAKFLCGEMSDIEGQNDDDGRWIDVPVIDNAIVVNIGDCLEVWTDSRIKATPHRVIRSSGGERFSFPFFFEPVFDTWIDPIENTTNITNNACTDGVGKEKKNKFHYGRHIAEAYARSFPDHPTSKKLRELGL